MDFTARWLVRPHAAGTLGTQLSLGTSPPGTQDVPPAVPTGSGRLRPTGGTVAGGGEAYSGGPTQTPPLPPSSPLQASAPA